MLFQASLTGSIISNFSNNNAQVETSVRPRILNCSKPSQSFFVDEGPNNYKISFATKKQNYVEI